MSVSQVYFSIDAFKAMAWYLKIMYIAMPMLLLKSADTNHGGRNKRVILGLTATDTDRDAYDSFRYYVYLAKGLYFGAIQDEPPWWTKWIFKDSVTPKLHELLCSGSLLTPSIVQTACHCLSKWNRKKSRNYTHVNTMNVWEDRIYSYVGSNDIHGMYDMLVPAHYIVYESCRRINVFHYNIMDFGLIISREKINKKAKKAALSYAPAYRAETIRRYYYETLAKEYMCLQIGHGLWQIDINDRGKPYITQLPSELQRWGWRTAMNFMDCTTSLYNPLERDEYYFPNYTEDTTWICVQAFQLSREYLYLMGSGDSGGPMTCNNVYVAVNSFSFALDSKHVLSAGNAIAFTAFENSVEYRDNLIEYCDTYIAIPDVPVPHPGPDDLNPTAPPNIIHYSFSPPGIAFLNPITILSIVSLALYN